MPAPPSQPKPVYLRRSVWIIYGILFSVAIPWYWSGNNTSTIAGIPLWVATSIGASAVISVFTAWLLLRHWPSDAELDSTDS